MKKCILYILIAIMILIPSIVFAADECDPSSVKIENVEINDTRGNIEENSNATSNNNELNLDLNMNVPGDSIEYKLTLKNTSDTDYYFDENSLVKNMDNVEYEFSYSDGDNIVKSGEEKIVILKVTYKDKVAADQLNNGSMTQNDVVTLNLTNKSIDIPDTLKNSKTVLIIVVLLIIVAGILLILKQRRTSLMVIIFAFCIQLIPLTVLALCKCELNVNSRIEIDGKEAIFLTGMEVNTKMKALAGDDLTTVSSGYAFSDTNITSIKYSNSEPIDSNKEEKNIVSTDESNYPIYMWYDNGTIYWWSEDNTPSLNRDARFMFVYLKNLSDISGVENFDTSDTELLYYTFYYDNLENVDALRKWNTGKVGTLYAFLAINHSLNDISGIANFDTSSLVNMGMLFYDDTSLTTIEPIKNWDVSNVENFSALLTHAISLRSLSGLENWNTKSAKYMNNTFSNLTLIESIEEIRNWDTSNVSYMQATFSYDNNLKSLEPIKNWDVSNVEKMDSLFNHNISLTSLEGLENWDTSKVDSMQSMFHNCVNLEDASAISDWDVSNVEYINHMFNISNDVITEQKYSNLPNLNIKNWNMPKVKKYDYFIESLRYVETEFTIRSTSVESYEGMLGDCAKGPGRVVINYTSESEEIVDQMLATVSNNPNIVKGELVE